MILENLKVKHKAFGEGVVVSTSGKYFTVKFETAEKVFVYPDIFEKFLTLSDGSVSAEINADIKIAKEAKQQIQNKKDEENLRAMTRGIVIPGKENLNSETDEEEAREKNSEAEEI
jgi:hypothetical protein